MYWPDLSPKKKKRPRMWLILLIGTLLGIYFAGTLNSWWPVLSLPKQKGLDNVVVAEQQPFTIISTIDTVGSSSQGLAGNGPDFALPDLFNESVVHTLSQYKGRPVIINFWASGCPPCRTEMPAFQRAYEQYGADGLAILAINQTYSDDIDAARKFANEMDLTFPLIRDDTGTVSLEEFEVLGLPTTIIINPDGTVATIQVGQMSDEQIKEISSRLIEGKPIP